MTVRVSFDAKHTMSHTHTILDKPIMYGNSWQILFCFLILVLYVSFTLYLPSYLSDSSIGEHCSLKSQHIKCSHHSRYFEDLVKCRIRVIVKLRHLVKMCCRDSCLGDNARKKVRSRVKEKKEMVFSLTGGKEVLGEKRRRMRTNSILS